MSSSRCFKEHVEYAPNPRRRLKGPVVEPLKPCLELWAKVRSAVEYENNLVNDRITWLLTLQGLLFAAAGLFASGALKWDVTREPSFKSTTTLSSAESQPTTVETTRTIKKRSPDGKEIIETVIERTTTTPSLHPTSDTKEVTRGDAKTVDVNRVSDGDPPKQMSVPPQGKSWSTTSATFSEIRWLAPYFLGFLGFVGVSVALIVYRSLWGADYQLARLDWWWRKKVGHVETATFDPSEDRYSWYDTQFPPLQLWNTKKDNLWKPWHFCRYLLAQSIGLPLTFVFVWCLLVILCCYNSDEQVWGELYRNCLAGGFATVLLGFLIHLIDRYCVESHKGTVTTNLGVSPTDNTSETVDTNPHVSTSDKANVTSIFTPSPKPPRHHKKRHKK